MLHLPEVVLEGVVQSKDLPLSYRHNNNPCRNGKRSENENKFEDQFLKARRGCVFRSATEKVTKCTKYYSISNQKKSVMPS